MGKELPAISVEQYAGIRAALAEEIPLEEILAQEGVPDWHWPTLDREMAERLTSDPPAFESFAASLARAEDHLRRRVTPLDDDLGAWTAFVAALGTEPELLERHGLRATDLGRLQRAWGDRFASDRDLARRAESLAKEPGDVPARIDADPVALTPFPWSPGYESAQASRALEPLAFLAATEGARRRPGPTLPFGGESPPPPARLALEPSPEMGSTSMVAGKPARPATPFEPAPEVVPVVPAPSPPISPALVSPRAHWPVPPSSSQSSGPASSPASSRPPSSLEPVAALGGTAPITARPSGPAVPFRGQAPAPPSAADSFEPVADLGLTKSLSESDPFDPMKGLLPPQPLEAEISLADTRARLEPDADLAATHERPRDPSDVETTLVVPFRGQKGAPASAVASLEPNLGLGMTAATSSG
ncbi:MAG: hypothetical protein KC731_41365, partial [Myxococcales bacterium]|nr:hypothetical protein [Myxococcales bacterium]